MDFGLLFAFRNPRQWRRPADEIYREQIEQAVLAEQLGYDHIWITEQHFSEDGWAPSLLPILAAVATRTKRIRIGSFILSLPFHNPLRVAEDAATVDIISGGRLDLGVGPGGIVAKALASFGVPFKQRRPRTVEGLEIIRRCFTEERFDFEGKYYQFSDVRVTPKPIQKPHPPLWVAAVGPKALAETAAGGYHLAASGTPEHQRIYDGALRKAGRNIADYSIAQLRMIYLAETRDQAWDEIQNHLHHTLNWYRAGIIAQRDVTLEKDFALPSLPPPHELRKINDLGFFVPAIVGTSEDAIRMLEAYFEETRVTHLAMWMHLAGLDARKSRRSMELFAKEVIPHFRR